MEKSLIERISKEGGVGGAITPKGKHPHAPPKGKRPPKVCVIGGGASGLAAVRQLLNAGADVMLIESRARLGGRLNTVNLPERCAPLRPPFSLLRGEHGPR